MSRPISEIVQRHVFVPGVEDTHGNPLKMWADPVNVGVFAFDPGSSSEPRLPGQDRVIVEPTLYFPSTETFGPKDQVTARGDLYDVDGETREWRHPRGYFLGNVVTLHRVDG